MAQPRKSGQRYTREQRQEDISRYQFCECMTLYGWLPESIKRDIGEDMLVRIRNRDQDTGVTFFAQLKSVTSSTVTKQEDVLSYRLDVKDLLHWDQFAQPVVLFVWNVDLREGNWVLLDSAIRQLDSDRPDWKGQITVTVRVPLSNTTDAHGLRSLRKAIGDALFPMIARGRPIELHVDIVVPDIDDAHPTRVALERFHREGFPVTIGRQYIANFEFSEWWAGWYLEPGDEISQITIGSVTSEEFEPVSIFLFSTTGDTVHFPSIELRVVRAGTDVIELSNLHQDSSIVFTISVPRNDANLGKGKLNFACKRAGYNLLETRDQIRFLQGIQSGGRLVFVFHRHRAARLTMNFTGADLASNADIQVDSRFADLIDKLCVVQGKIGVPLSVPEGDISPIDMNAAIELFEIVQTGKTVVKRPTLSLPVTDIGMLRELLRLHLADPNGRRLAVRQDSPTSYVEIFGEKIDVGPVITTAQGTLEVDVERFSQYVDANDESVPINLVLRDVEIIQEFSRW